jgi:hypothetical protein
MRYQNKTYIQTDVNSRNYNVNPFNISSDIYSIKNPNISVTGATSGITIGDNVYLENTSGLTLDIGVDDYFIDNDLGDITLNFYERADDNFSGEIIYQVENINTSVSTVVLPLNVLNSTDTEVLLSVIPNIKSKTYTLNRLEDYSRSYSEAGSDIKTFNSDTDFYLINTYLPSDITLENSFNDEDELGVLTVDSFLIESGITTNQLNLTEIPKGDVLVSVNGLTIPEGISGYTVSYDSNSIIFENDLVYEDVINASYVTDGVNNGLSIESLYLEEPFLSGTTTGITENFFYNTDEDKFEISLDSVPLNPDSVILTLNGVTLTNETDYSVVDGTNRLLIDGLLLDDDIVNIVYNSYESYLRDLDVDELEIVWSIEKEVSDEGFFTFVMYNSELEIIEETNIDYTSDTTYSINLNFTNVDNGVYYFKVVNNKTHRLLTGSSLNKFKETELIKFNIER